MSFFNNHELGWGGHISNWMKIRVNSWSARRASIMPLTWHDKHLHSLYTSSSIGPTPESVTKQLIAVCLCMVTPEQLIALCLCMVTPKQLIAVCLCMVTPKQLIAVCLCMVTPKQLIAVCLCMVTPKQLIPVCLCMVTPFLIWITQRLPILFRIIQRHPSKREVSTQCC